MSLLPNIQSLRQLLTAIFLLLVAGASAERRALIIGINDYSASGGKVRSLAGCVADAKSMQALLITRFGFPARNIDTLFDRQASKRNMLAALRRLERSVQKDDVVFFYYAGHGVSLINRFAMKGDSTTQGLLAADVSSPENSVIFDFELSAIYNRIIARGAVLTVVFDCCHSGNMTLNFSAAQQLTLRRSGESARGVMPANIWGDYEAIDALRLLQQDSMLADGNDPAAQLGDTATTARLLPYTDEDLRLRINVQRPHEIPGSKFLFFAAAQGEQKALEKRDAFGQQHGVFTMSLVAAYNELPASTPVQTIMAAIQQRFKDQFIIQRQLPNILTDPWRLQQHLAGSPLVKPTDVVVVPGGPPGNGVIPLAAGKNAGLQPGFVLQGMSNATLQIKVVQAGESQASAVLVKGTPAIAAAEKQYRIVGRTAEVQPALTIYVPAQPFTLAELRTLDQAALKPAMALPKMVRYGSNPDARMHVFFDNKQVYVVQGNGKPATANLATWMAGAAQGDPFFVYLPLPAELLQAVQKSLARNAHVRFTTDAAKANFGLYMAYDAQAELVAVCTHELVGTRLAPGKGPRPEHLSVKLKDPWQPNALATQTAQLTELILRTAGTFRWLQ